MNARCIFLLPLDSHLLRTVSSSFRQENTLYWALTLRACPFCTVKSKSYIQLKNGIWDSTGRVMDPNPAWNWSMVLTWRRVGGYCVPGDDGTREERISIYISICIQCSVGCITSSSVVWWCENVFRIVSYFVHECCSCFGSSLF